MEPSAAARQVREVIDRLMQDGAIVARADGTLHQIFPIAVGVEEGSVLRRWVVQVGATQTIEVGLAYGISALSIAEGLLINGHSNARHVAIDPFQSSRFADCGLQVLADAGLAAMVEHHAEKSHFALPRLLSEGRCFDLGFIDGNHRFDGVFLDLYYLGLLVRRGGTIIVHDYDLPGIQRAVAFFVTNLNWTVEETSQDLVVLQTASAADSRDFTYFIDF